MVPQPTYDALAERVAALEKKLEDTQKKLVVSQEGEQLYRSVLDNARDAIYLMDIDTEKLIYANNTAQQMVGKSIEGTLGSSLYEMVKIKENDIAKERLKRLLKGETLDPQEYTFLKTGKRFSWKPYPPSSNLRAGKL